MADLFWNIATSYPALSIVAAIGLAALIVGHVPFGKYAPVIGPYVVLAQFVAYPTLMLLAFLVGVRITDERAVTRQLKNDLAWSQNEIEQQKATAEDAERLKAEAQAEANEAKGKLDDYRKQYADRPQAVCAFTADDLARLRALRRAK